MLVVRAIEEGDLEGLLSLAQQTDGGMTRLKPDREALSKRIDIACASFAQQIVPSQRDYVFVLEDTAERRLAGVCAIKSAVGLDEPFYNFRLGSLMHSSRELGILSLLQTLCLSNDLTGNAELCSLFMHPDYRQGSNGRMLSKCRLLFIAQFPHLFPQAVFAEMRGFQRADGTSPFWDSLGRHFFDIYFEQADNLSGPSNKAFIAELMPRYPLYVSYLSQEAQDAIGVVHVDTVPARRLLEQEGLYFKGAIDIFDGGPVLQADVRELRASRESVLNTVVAHVPQAADAVPLLVSNTTLHNFRVIVAEGDPKVRQLVLSDEQKAALACQCHDKVRVLPLNPLKNISLH